MLLAGKSQPFGRSGTETGGHSENIPKLAGTALAVTLVGGAATALAAPIALPTGPIFGKYLGVEQVAPGNNTVGVGSPFPATSGTTGADCAGCVNENLTTDKEGTFGVFVIDTLQAGSVITPHQDIAQSGFPFFVNGQNGGNQITGFFYGTNVKSLNSTGANGNGGIVDLYWWDVNNQSQAAADAANPATLRTSQTDFTGYTCANPPPGASGCTFLARLDLVPGTTDNGTTVDPTLTARARGDLAGTSIGTSQFYLETDLTAPGAWTSQLAGQWFQFNFDGLVLPDIADVFAQYDFLHCTTGCSAWNNSTTGALGENLNDPIKFFTTAVPEPGSLALLGTALLGLGVPWCSRRRRDLRLLEVSPSFG